MLKNLGLKVGVDRLRIIFMGTPDFYHWNA